MTFKNNRAPLLCYIKLCATFRSHWWIQTGVTVQKRPICVKCDDFESRVTLKFDGWPWETIGHSPKHYQAICIISSSYMNSNCSYSPETVKLGCDLRDPDFDLWPRPFAWTSLLSLVITPENFMMIRWWEHSQKGVTDGRTDSQTDRQTDGRTEPFIELLGRSWIIAKQSIYLCTYLTMNTCHSCPRQLHQQTSVETCVV